MIGFSIKKVKIETDDGPKRERSVGKMEIIGASILASVITTKILATYYFKKVDGYVKEMCEMTIKSNKDTLSILRNTVRDISTGKEHEKCLKLKK